jgi:hypothetical protein
MQTAFEIGKIFLDLLVVGFTASHGVFSFIEGCCVLVGSIVFIDFSTGKHPYWEEKEAIVMKWAGIVFLVSIGFSMAVVAPVTLVFKERAEKETAKADDAKSAKIALRLSTENATLKENVAILTNRVDVFAIATGLTNLPYAERARAFFSDYDRNKEEVVKLRNEMNALHPSVRERITNLLIEAEPTILEFLRRNIKTNDFVGRQLFMKQPQFIDLSRLSRGAEGKQYVQDVVLGTKTMTNTYKEVFWEVNTKISRRLLDLE